MLTNLYQALIQQLRHLQLPIYLADCVPDGAALPYVTAEIAVPITPGSSGSLTLTIWCTGEESNLDRLARTDTLYSVLPPRGAWVNTITGAALLTMDQPSSCVQEAGLLGLRSRWTLRHYPTT